MSPEHRRVTHDVFPAAVVPIVSTVTFLRPSSLATVLETTPILYLVVVEVLEVLVEEVWAEVGLGNGAFGAFGALPPKGVWQCRSHSTAPARWRRRDCLQRSAVLEKEAPNVHDTSKT